jgi:hypothetical protein
MADQIIMRSVESLIPYVRNARTHPLEGGEAVTAATAPFFA